MNVSEEFKALAKAGNIAAYRTSPAVLGTAIGRLPQMIPGMSICDHATAFGSIRNILRWQRKFPIPSSAAFGRIGEEYVKELYRFAEAYGIPVVYFGNSVSG